MVRLLMCGSVPPEWGGKTGGGVATVHRILIEEIAARGRDYGIEVAGLLPFNLDKLSSRRPPVRTLFIPEEGVSDTEFYQRVLGETRADAVVFQHVAHRWAVIHGQVNSPIPALGVIHSWNALRFRPPDVAQRVRRTLERAIPACDCLVFVSENTRIEGEDLGFTYPARSAVIHNPVTPSFLDDFEVDRQCRDGWVFLGSLVERKNPLATLIASARCKRRLAFVGSGDEEVRLRAQARVLGVEDRVSFVGWASPEDVRAALLSSELLCLPSHGEGFSMAYLEALACGTPIVGAGANVLELSARIGMSCGAPVWEGTVDEVVAAARDVQESAWDRHELRRRTVEKFSPTAVMAAYSSVIHDMTAARHRVEGM